jgi:signal transduction histidine kinase
MKQLRFRTRLIVILSLFAIVPALVLTLMWTATLSTALPFISGKAAWERTAASGQAAIAVMRKGPLTNQERAVLAAHERELRTSVEQSQRYSFLASRTIRVVLLAGFIALIFLSIIVSRVGGHLSRQLSRPLDELVHWTELIERGEKLPDPATTAPKRGAPEFETLRSKMRGMASALEVGRQRAVEAERIRAFRESARTVAHELKNPLTPIRFALDRLRREVSPELQENIDVLETESRRLERLARSFSEFGRLPEGTRAKIDVGEMARYAASSSVPDKIQLELEIQSGLQPVNGYHDALSAALSNILLNAVDACNGNGTVGVSVKEAKIGDRSAVAIAVRDNGCGIPEKEIERIWDPYVTHKPGGTGLGLPIARQTILAHGGTIKTTSVVGKGTEITVKLPISQGV